MTGLVCYLCLNPRDVSPPSLCPFCRETARTTTLADHLERERILRERSARRSALDWVTKHHARAVREHFVPAPGVRDPRRVRLFLDRAAGHAAEARALGATEDDVAAARRRAVDHTCPELADPAALLAPPPGVRP